MKLDRIKGLFKEKGLLSGKKVLTATIIGTVLIASTGTALAASNITITDGKWENKLSHGRVEYVDADGGGEVVIDSADLDTLAVEVNTCNSKIDEIITGLGIDATSGTVDLSLLQAGDVVLNPNGTIKSATGTGASVGGAFSGLLAKSVTVDCSDADVTADNLSAGVKAYNASGALITGTGADNEKNYTLGRIDGYAEGITGIEVSYRYHHHEGDDINGGPCYEAYQPNIHRSTQVRSQDGQKTPMYIKCSICGRSVYCDGKGGQERHNYDGNYDYVYGSCSGDPTIYYRLCCGKTEETIEEAIIKFVD